MSGYLNAQRVLGWVAGGIDCDETYQEITETSASGDSSSTHEVRDIFVVKRSRRVYGVTGFQKATGTMQSLFNLRSGPVTSFSFGTIGVSSTAIFRCKSDRLIWKDLRLGYAEQVQIWEHRSPWRELEATFEGGGS